MSNLEKKANDQIKKAKEIENESSNIINSEKIEKKRKKKEKWLSEAKKSFKDSKDNYKKSINFLKKSKEASKNREESKEYAKEAKRYSKKAMKESKRAIRLNNRIEERTKKRMQKNLTVKNIFLSLLFLYTLTIIITLAIFNKEFVNLILEIFYRYLGRYETARLFSWGLLLFMMSVLVGFVIWGIDTFNKEKTKWWFLVTIVCILWIGSTGFLFVHMTIGQDNLDLKLRNQSNDAIGVIKCRGSTEVILILDNVICAIEPNLKNISANVSFKINETYTVVQSFDNLNFTAPERVEYLSFQIQGFDGKENLIFLSTGSPYHFYTKEEFNDLRARFLKYLLAILALIFITIPTVIYQLKKIYE